MRRIAILNQKGGVGKTTTSVNLGAALARAGKRVCILDLDPQAHASTHLGIEPDGQSPSMYEVLIENRPLADVRQQADENLWVVRSDINLAAAEVELAGVVGREVILRDLLQADAEAFDFVLMDCAPSLGVLTLNALCAADEVFIPLQPHFLALHGLSKLLETTGL
ncbi:MAG TPA: AAA family ATPase, partial [Gemmataceae bacterium]|nr:AAA family ATPase [Gemmataceae bacterium]